MSVKVTLKRNGEWQPLGKKERNGEKEIKLEFIEQKQSNGKREREKQMENGRKQRVKKITSWILYIKITGLNQ